MPCIYSFHLFALFQIYVFYSWWWVLARNVLNKHVLYNNTCSLIYIEALNLEKHLRWVSRAASQRLGILRKCWQVFDDRSLLGRCFRGFVLPVIEYYSALWCSAADTHFKLLDRAVSDARFLTVVVFEYDTAHRRSVAVLLMLYKIRCNPMHQLNGALPGHMCQCGLHVVPCSHSGICMRRLAAEPRSTAWLLFLVPLERSCWPRIRWCGTGGFQDQGQCFFIYLSCSIPTIVF